MLNSQEREFAKRTIRRNVNIVNLSGVQKSLIKWTGIATLHA